MGDFTKTITTEAGEREFYFMLLHAVSGAKYYVTVSDDLFKSILFHMEQRHDRWEIIDAPKVPQWIHDLRPQLEQFIVDSESKSSSRRSQAPL